MTKHALGLVLQPWKMLKLLSKCVILPFVWPGSWQSPTFENPSLEFKIPLFRCLLATSVLRQFN